MKLGLALSGGGVRGVAHLGVLKALEEYQIQPTVVSGVSAGSFAGAFYAAGYSAEEALEFIHSTRFFSIMNYTLRKPGLLDSENYRKVLLKHFPEDSFEALDKELYIVATDLVAAKQKVFHSGSLIDAILASCAFPLIYSPVKIDGVLYADGGIINNLPSDVLQNKCDKIIGVFVNPIKKMEDPTFKSSFSVMERAYEITKVAVVKSRYECCDWLIRPQKLVNFMMFDLRTKTANEIFQIGYETGLEWAEKIATELKDGQSSSPANTGTQ